MEENGFELIHKLTPAQIEEISKRFGVNRGHIFFKDLIIPTLETLHTCGYFRLYEVEKNIEIQFIK